MLCPFSNSASRLGWRASAGVSQVSSSASCCGLQSPGTGTTYASETACCRGSWNGVTRGREVLGDRERLRRRAGSAGARPGRGPSRCAAAGPSRTRSWYSTRPETSARVISPSSRPAAAVRSAIVAEGVHPGRDGVDVQDRQPRAGGAISSGDSQARVGRPRRHVRHSDCQTDTPASAADRLPNHTRELSQAARERLRRLGLDGRGGRRPGTTPTPWLWRSLVWQPRSSS